jgi:hypothetical protein
MWNIAAIAQARGQTRCKQKGDDFHGQSFAPLRVHANRQSMHGSLA